MDQASNLRNIMNEKSNKILKLKKKDDTSLGGIPRVIAVTSGKGGVGKTNIVGNLAIACQRMGKRVLIFDADLGLANIDIIYGIHPPFTIKDVIRGDKSLSEIIVESHEGVSIIPASSGVYELSNLSEGHKINLLNEFDLLNKMFDLLLIDTGAGISSNVLYFNLAAQERMVVVTPEPTSITDAYALIKILHSYHETSNFYLLMNMVKDEKEAKNVYGILIRVIEKFMGDISVDYAGYIPVDKRLQDAVARKSPVVCCYPDSESSKRFYELARFIIDNNEVQNLDGNIKFFWKRLITSSSSLKNESSDK